MTRQHQQQRTQQMQQERDQLLFELEQVTFFIFIFLSQPTTKCLISFSRPIRMYNDNWKTKHKHSSTNKTN